MNVLPASDREFLDVHVLNRPGAYLFAGLSLFRARGVSSGFIVETVISLTHLAGSDGLGPFGFEPMLKRGR